MEKLRNLASDIEKVSEEYSGLTWVQFTTGFDFGIDKKYEEMMSYYTSKENFEYVRKTFERNNLGEFEKREAELMFKSFEPFHLSDEVNKLNMEISSLTNKLSGVLNTHRSTINGVEMSSVELAQIMRNSDDESKRKEAYFARTQVNKPLFDAGFAELINLRKEYAKLRGFDTFVDLQLDANELDSNIFSSWKDELHEMVPAMNEKRSEMAGIYLGKNEVMPWDEAYLVSKIAPSLNKKVDMTEFYQVLRDFYKKFGFDLDKYNITYDIFPRKNKSEWGYNFPIAVEKDARVLANVKNEYNEYGVLLHETGHGVHHFLQKREEMILNQGISGIITEGIANLFGSFLYDESFFSRFFTDNKIKEELKRYEDYSKVNSLRAIPSIMFDQDLYRTDIKTLDDINDLAFKTTKDYLGVDRFGDQYPWGFRIHHTTHPIYLHNYFMGDVTSELLKKSFKDKFGVEKVSEKPMEFGNFLYEQVIKPSGKYKYAELVKKISGKEFSLECMK